MSREKNKAAQPVYKFGSDTLGNDLIGFLADSQMRKLIALSHLYAKCEAATAPGQLNLAYRQGMGKQLVQLCLKNKIANLVCLIYTKNCVKMTNCGFKGVMCQASCFPIHIQPTDMRVYQSSHQILGNKANIANISPNVKLFSLLKSSVGYLQDSEVFKNTVHHVFFRQMFEFVDKVDHVLAHRRAVDPVNALSSLQAGVLRLQHGHTQSIK